MAIDGIGKSGGVVPSPEVAGPTATGAVEKPFEVERAEPVEKAAAADATSATSPLARLSSGQLDLNGYLDAKVEEATAGLHGLDPADLADIKQVLRDQLACDPGLVDRVHQATGSLPEPPADE